MASRFFSSRRELRPLLDGVLVVELASVLAGPSAGQFLAELGATVVKVENTTTRGDVTRTWRLPSERGKRGSVGGSGSDGTGAGTESNNGIDGGIRDDMTARNRGGESEGDSGRSDDSVTAYFSACNMGKQSVAIDLRDASGLNACHRLLRSADVVLASYKPGDAERLGVDYATARALNPAVVYAQITGYGVDDDRAGYDAVIQAESGFQYMNGLDAPTKMPVAMMDLLASHQIKEGVLAGLLRRAMGGGDDDDRTTCGSLVSVSLLGAGVSALANQGTGYLREGVVPQRMGNDHPVICPYGTIFECADGGLITLAVGSDAQWRGLCGVLQMPDDERFSTNPLRVEHRGACKEAVQEKIAAF